MSADSTDLAAAATSFARDILAPRADLHDLTEFPDAIWQAYKAAGLTGVGLPAACGGAPASWAEIAELGRILVAIGGNLGVATSWLGHVVIAKLHVLRLGSATQRRNLLPALARGTKRIAMAISEPGAGAHPKHMKTTATRQGDGYVLNGEKTYLTNGPVADLFVTLAITGEVAGRKAYSAFLVPRATAGLTVTPTLAVDFLRPAPHCGIRLDSSPVALDALLGHEGQALVEVSQPMRTVEDAVMAGAKLGALHYELKAAAVAARTQGRAGEETVLAALGDLAARLAGLRAILDAMMARLDDAGSADPELPILVAAFRGAAQGYQEIFNEHCVDWALDGDAKLAALARDITKSAGIAGAVHHIRQLNLGRRMIAETEIHD